MKYITKIISSWYFRWLLIGIFIRLIISAFTLHSDLWAFSFSGRIFAEEGVFNVYEYLRNLPLNSQYRVYGTDFFTYPPLTYFVLGFFRFLLQPFFDQGFYSQLFANLGLAYQLSGIFLHSLMVKLPYLLFDIGLAFILTRFFEEEKKKRMIFLFWIFNPVSWYTSFMIGQFDIIPTMFVVLSLYFAIKGKSDLSLVSLGIGGAFKLFPLFLIPFAALILSGDNRKWLKLTLIGFLPFLLTIAPFLTSQAFRSTVLFGTQSQKFLYAGINVSGADALYLFLVFYFLFLFYTAHFLRNVKNLWVVFLIIFLILFSLTNYHPQWFLWITPFLIIWIVDRPQLWFYPISLFAVFVGILFLFEPSLSIGLFSPIFFPLHQIQGMSVIVEKFMPTSQVLSILRSLFAAISLFMVWLSFHFVLIKNQSIHKS